MLNVPDSGSGQALESPELMELLSATRSHATIHRTLPDQADLSDKADVSSNQNAAISSFIWQIMSFILV